MDSIWLCSFLLTVITGREILCEDNLPKIPIRLEVDRRNLQHTIHSTVLPFPGYAVYSLRKKGHSLDVVPITEESYKQAVLPHFLDGLNSLNSVAEILQTNTDFLQDIPNNVRQLLESSFKSLSKAEQTSKAQERTVSTNVEQCMNTIKKLGDEQKILEDEQQRLMVQLSGLQVQASLARDQLRAAQEAANNANNARNRAHQAKQAAEEERNKGIGMLFIPFAGPILGGIAISDAIKAMEAAEREADSALRNNIYWMNEARNYESRVQSLRNEIGAMGQNIVDKSTEILYKEVDLSGEKTWAKHLQEFLIPLRKCTSLLGSMESTNVMEFIETLTGLVPALNDIIVAVRPLIERSSDYQLLISSRVLGIIAKLEEANRRLDESVG